MADDRAPHQHRGGRVVVTARGLRATVAISDDDDPELRALAHEVLAAARAAGVDVVLEDLTAVDRAETARATRVPSRRERAGAP